MAHTAEEVVEAVDCNFRPNNPRDQPDDHFHLVPQNIKNCPILHVRVRLEILSKPLPDIAEKTVAAASAKHEVRYRSQRTNDIPVNSSFITRVCPGFRSGARELDHGGHIRSMRTKQPS